jgi:hypothetical protein
LIACDDLAGVGRVEVEFSFGIGGEEGVGCGGKEGAGAVVGEAGLEMSGVEGDLEGAEFFAGGVLADVRGEG